MKNRGITLVSLVITIIILIILTGISLNLTLGQNGLFQMALKAKENMELAQVEEEKTLNTLYAQLELQGGSIGGTESGGTSYDAIQKLLEFKQEIANAIEQAGGNAIEEPTTAEKEEFEEAITGIVAKVTSDADATEEDIAEGKTAWVKGEQITGNAKTTLPVNSVIWKSGSGPWDFSEEFPDGAGFDINNCYILVSNLTTFSVTTTKQNPYAGVDTGTFVPTFPKCSGNYDEVSASASISLSHRTNDWRDASIPITILGCAYINQE